MSKIIAVSIRNSIDSSISDKARIIELDEISKYLDEGYYISNREVIITPTSSVFTVLYHLDK